MNNISLTDDELTRYSRALAVDGFGEAEQLKLKHSSALVIGCGAVGSVAAAYLAAAGIGRMTIADFDTIGISNLQRQVFFTTSCAGLPKAEVLGQHLSDLNPLVKLTVSDKKITPVWLEEHISEFDLVIECSDSASTKLMVSAACHSNGIPCCIGGVDAFKAQVFTQQGEVTPYCELFPGCCDDRNKIRGVMGPVPGIVGSLLASEAIKLLASAGSTLAGMLWQLDTATMQTTLISVKA